MYKVAIEHADNYRLESVKNVLRKCFDDLGYPAQNPLGGDNSSRRQRIYKAKLGGLKVAGILFT